MPSNSVSQTGTTEIYDAELARPNLLLVFLGSLIAMVPWPVLAISLGTLGSMFEQASDFTLLFGGVTMIFLLPIGVLDPPEWVIALIFAFVWIVVLFLPVLVLARRERRKAHMALFFILQAGFSIAQAGLGLLMIAGRHV